jgi:hypothetical protein
MDEVEQIGVPGEILIFVTVAAPKHSRAPKSKELRLRMSLPLARKGADQTSANRVEKLAFNL